MTIINDKGTLFALLFLFYSCEAFSFSNTDSLLQVLSHTIENKDSYIGEKQDRIAQLKGILEGEDLSLLGQFILCEKLHREYQTFNYDSAFAYAVKLQKLANKLGEPAKQTYSKLKLSHTLLSSGLYKEALDSLNKLDPQALPDSIKIDFYALKARTYYDLSGYTQDNYYSSHYIKSGEKYVDSALILLDENTLQYHALRGMKYEAKLAFDRAKADFKTILDEFNPSLHQYAMATNSLGNIYYKQGNTGKGINMMARAAIADIKASVKEGVALMTLAEWLYRHGDEKRAYDYINQALEDADFYGAKQRKIQVAAILPVIGSERLATVQEQRSHLLVYFVAVSLLSLLVVAFIVIIFRQLKQLRKTKKIITDANVNLQKTNGRLKDTNMKLEETNAKLLEANLIKEEYIGYSFNMYTDYIHKIEQLKRAVDKKMMVRKYEDINHVLESVNLKKERDRLFQSFDKVFLKLFPDFLVEFNAFFKEEDQFVLKDPQSLTIELRIFALIRLGIHDHEQIAAILEYSVRTIYNYKTKVKNKSILSNEEFEQKVMGIKAF